nr:hypothetical protein [Tanacetum cinerariifolium]
MTGDDNHDGDHPETSNPSPPVPPPTQQIPHTVSSIKLPILKKGEYDIWAMKMEHYLSHIDYPVWQVIQNGNGHVSVTTYTNGMIKILPPKTAEEVVARERERKARITLLIALTEDHLAKFYKTADAKEMFQTLLSQLEIHGDGVSHKDANQKFLTFLHSSWSQVALIMRTKPGLDTLSFDDLYNNLRVFDHDVKGTTASSSNTQNVTFVSAENTSSTNDVSTAYNVSSPSVLKSQKEGSSSYTDETKVECFNCHKIRHFTRDCKAKGNQDSRRRDVGYNGNKARDNGKRPAYQDDSKALVTIDGEDIDWSGHVEEDAQNYAMMAYSSSNSGSVNEVEAQLLCHQQNQLAYEQKIRFMKIDFDVKTDVLAYHKKLLAEALKEKEDLKTKFENWQNSSKNLSRLLNTQMSANDKFGLGYRDYKYGSILSYENEVLQILSPITGNYMPFEPDVEIDYSKFTYGPKQALADESDSKPSEYAFCKSDSSVETTISMPAPLDNAPKVVYEPTVWTDAPIIEEYESDSDNDSVSNVQKDKEKPSFAFIDYVKHVKTSRENVKETGTPNHIPKVEK